MRHRFTIALALSILAAGTAGAQPPAPPADAPLTVQAAIALARANSQAFKAATTAAAVATEDRRQARAAMLPSVSGLMQYIDTEPNGTPSGVWVPNDGPRVYYTYGTVHADLFAPSRWADYRAAAAGEAAARARADVAARGLVATVVQNFYGLLAADRKLASARQGLTEARQFRDITERQERAGEVAHSDVVKAQIQVAQRERDAQDAELAALKSRLGLSILIFPDFRDTFAVADDLQADVPLPPLAEVEASARQASPDLRASRATLAQQSSAVTSARSGLLPTVSFDYFYGIEANEFAKYDPEGHRLLGSVWQAQMSIPLWNWGATMSRVRQAELRAAQAQADVALTERELRANIASFHAEARTAGAQVASLKSSLDLAAESLRLTILRYQAGEVSVLEVVDAQATLIQARNAYDDGLVRYRVALAALQTLTGTL